MAEEGSTLASEGQALFQLFSEALHDLERREQSTHIFLTLRNEHQRFTLWSQNLGLTSPSHRSLDYRLQNAPVIRKTIKAFFIDLRDSLNELQGVLHDHQPVLATANEPLEIPTASKAGYSASPDLANTDDAGSDLSETPSSILREVTSNISDIVEKLFELAFLIRSPSVRAGFSNRQLTKYFDESSIKFMQEIERSRLKDYLSQLRQPHKAFVAENTAADEMDTAIFERTVLANIQRRQQLLFWKRRERANRNESQRPPDVKTQAVLPERTAIIQAPAMQSQMSYGSRILTQSLVSYTVTKVEEKKLGLPVRASTPSIASRTPTIYDSSGNKVEWPKAPLEPHGWFECPYCFEMCPPHFREPKEWRLHLTHDIQPYNCTYYPCDTGDQLFDNREDWISHERTYHRAIWRCQDHPNIEFASVELYRQHLKSDHRGLVAAEPKVLAPEIVDAHASVPLDADRACPFCWGAISSLDEMESHTAVHLESIALFTLPRPTEEDEDLSLSSKSSVSLRQHGIKLSGSRAGDFDDETPTFEDNSGTDDTNLSSRDAQPGLRLEASSLTTQNLRLTESTAEHDDYSSATRRYLQGLSQDIPPSEPSSEDLLVAELEAYSPPRNFISLKSHESDLKNVIPVDTSLELPLNSDAKAELDVTCDLCTALITREPVHGREQIPRDETHTRTNESLRVSASKGCHLCSIVLESIPLQDSFKLAHFGLYDAEPDGFPLQSLSSVKLAVSSTHKLADLANDFTYHGDLNTFAFASFASNDQTSLYTVSDPLSRPLIQWTGSKEIQEIARSWTMTCVHSHERCTSRSLEQAEFPEYPTRLVDIMSGSDKQELALRVVEMQSVLRAEYPRYAVLSYDSIRHNSNHDLQYSDVYHWSRLPLTFRQAITFLRSSALGLQYLWIDRLCILNHDKEDSEREVSRTFDYFSNAFLCISADASIVTYDEMFSSRPPLSLVPLKMTPGTIDDHSGLPPHLSIDGRIDRQTVRSKSRYESEGRRSSQHNERLTYLFPSMRFYESVQRSPVNSGGREWTKQKLTKRIVHFARGQVFWQCATLVAMDGMPDIDIHAHGFTRQRLTRPRLTLVDISKVLHAASPRIAYDLWLDAAAEFSQCNWSNMQERSTTIIGLARLFGVAIKDEFRYGTWRKTLFNDLLWTTTLPRIPSESKDGLPSWSWTSVFEAISFRGRGISSRAVVSFPDIEAIFDQAGQGREALRMQGYLSEMSLSSEDVPNSGGAIPHHVGHGDTYRSLLIYLDITTSSLKQPTTFYCLFLQLSSLTSLTDLEAKAPAPVIESSQLPSETEVAGAVGLVLKPVDSQGNYRRMGVFSFVRSVGKTPMTLADLNAKDLPPERYETKDEKSGLYTITVV